MAFHTHITEHTRSTGECALDQGASHLKTFGFGADMRLFAEPLAGASELCSPVHSIARKRTKRIVQAGVSRMYPAFCTVTASGSKPTPGGRLVLLLRLPPHHATNACRGPRHYAALRVTVSICDGPSVNAELRPWESNPLARLRQV